eukprot:2615987-Amphidinium_carterae.1
MVYSISRMNAPKCCTSPCLADVAVHPKYAKSSHISSNVGSSSSPNSGGCTPSEPATALANLRHRSPA